jgi:tetratricopeptide (TPR) repeat protein
VDEQREALRAGVRTQLQTATTARRTGDIARAREAYARVLVLEPENVDAATALRELEQQAMARTQADRAARARLDDVVANVKARAAAEGAEGYDLDQRLELLQAGDTTAGLRELRAWVDAHPKDRAGRQRIGAAVAERAQAEEARGQRERALALYEQAAALRGDTPPEWASRMQALRRVLSEEAYAAGVRVQRTDLAVAIARFEASLRYDPGNVKASTRLREARAAQAKLQRLPATK